VIDGWSDKGLTQPEPEPNAITTTYLERNQMMELLQLTSFNFTTTATHNPATDLEIILLSASNTTGTCSFLGTT
jgi:hypothetical protein